jgi:PqqD family protein of HPr-rel-A system
MASEKKWQSIKNIGVFTTQTDNDVIVYNPRSGETHQLNLMSLDALQFMQQPASLSQLLTHICSLYQVQNTDDIRAQLTSLLEQFDDLGLIHASCE